MSTNTNLFSRPAPWLMVIAVLALIFGLMTLVSAGSVLFGPEISKEMAGAYVPFVVWFNFAAGFLYVIAAVGIWQGRGWTFGLSLLIVLATGLTALAFARHVIAGEAFEMRTIGALGLRMGFWIAISFAIRRSKRRA